MGIPTRSPAPMSEQEELVPHSQITAMDEGGEEYSESHQTDNLAEAEETISQTQPLPRSPSSRENEAQSISESGSQQRSMAPPTPISNAFYTRNISAGNRTNLNNEDYSPRTPNSDVTPATPVSMAASTPSRRPFPRSDLGRNAYYASPRTPSSVFSHRSGRGSIPGSPVSATSIRRSDPIPQVHHDIAEDFAEAVVWGTDVSVQAAMRTFRDFLQTFKIGEDIDEEPYYLTLLARINETEEWAMNIYCRHLNRDESTRRLYRQLIYYPQVIIPIMDLVVFDEYSQRFGEPPLGQRIQVRTYGLEENELKPMRDLDPEDIDQLVCISGMIVRVSPIIPDCKQAFFRCTVCKSTTEVLIDRGRVVEPRICPTCSVKHAFEIVHNRCSFLDKQMIRMQETPDAIPEGETPHTVTLFAFDTLVDSVRPGDRVKVTGIFRALGSRPIARQSTLRSVYRTYIDVIHFEKQTQSSRFIKGAQELSEVTDPRKIAQMERAAADPLIYEKLASSLAPSIWELDDVKKGILCQLFGGCSKEMHGASAGKFRGEVNVLLCGDPGTSKSQLLGYVHKIAPRGIYTSGKGSSAVGLTASVVHDPETGELVLESGALVLSDRGICCIDEFDKMSDQTRSILHEAMEQQTVSIAKAGIIATLNARTSVLASANPVESRYNPNRSVIENIRLPPTLLSRFDLIFLILDKPNVDQDRRLAKHLVSLYFKQPTNAPSPYSMQFLTEYIAYARQNVHPVISDEATRDLIQGYLNLRRMGINKKTITATPRQLESLIRLAEAHAKIRFSQRVERKDVAEAIRLMNVATQKAATDPRTGTIDMDMITTGRTALERDTMDQLTEAVRELLKSRGSGSRMTLTELKTQLEAQASLQITLAELRDAVRSLHEDRVVNYHEQNQTVVAFS